MEVTFLTGAPDSHNCAVINELTGHIKLKVRTPDFALGERGMCLLEGDAVVATGYEEVMDTARSLHMTHVHEKLTQRRQLASVG